MPGSTSDRLKKAARERQARTGESYSIALMHARNAAPPVLLDPMWREKVGKFIVMPRGLSAEEWEASIAAGGGKGPLSTTPLSRNGEPARRVQVEMDPQTDEEALLRRELERAGISDVKDAWTFLRPKREDDAALLLAKSTWRERGVTDAHLLVRLPSSLNALMVDSRTGQVEPSWRVVRCRVCGKDLGDINIAVMIFDGGAVGPIEEEISAWQDKHRRRSRPCRLAFAVVGSEGGSRS